MTDIIKSVTKGVDVEKLALKKYPISIVPTDRFEGIKEYDQNKDAREYFIEGFKTCQALQSNAGGFSLEDMIEYEGASNWLAGWIWFDWGQELVVEYIAWKARRKWRKYKIYKRMKDVKKIN